MGQDGGGGGGGRCGYKGTDFSLKTYRSRLLVVKYTLWKLFNRLELLNKTFD